MGVRFIPGNAPIQQRLLQCIYYYTYHKMAVSLHLPDTEFYRHTFQYFPIHILPGLVWFDQKLQEL